MYNENTASSTDRSLLPKPLENNHVSVSGVIIGTPKPDHSVAGETFYRAEIAIRRLSSTKDLIPVLISDRLIMHPENLDGKPIFIEGQFRSHRKKDQSGRKHNRLNIFAIGIDVLDEIPADDTNRIDLAGTIHKKPIYRKTPLGREIADCLLKVERAYGKVDFIPCIIWGKNARFATTLMEGDRVHISGRIQNREYLKRISEAECETHTVYEVSASSIWPEQDIQKDSGDWKEMAY